MANEVNNYEETLSKFLRSENFRATRYSAEKLNLPNDQIHYLKQNITPNEQYICKVIVELDDSIVDGALPVKIIGYRHELGLSDFNRNFTVKTFDGHFSEDMNMTLVDKLIMSCNYKLKQAWT